MQSFFYILLLSAMFLLAGCAWFRDDRPEPDGSPYAAQPRQSQKTYTEAEAVNDAVSAVSLKIATASHGPFRVVPVQGKTASPGLQVIEALARMRLSRFDAPYTLQLEDVLTDSGEWTLILRNPDGTLFFTKRYLLKGKTHARS